MPNFADIHDAIFHTEVIDEPVHTRLVLAHLLAMADGDGNLSMTPQDFAREINLTVGQVEDALASLARLGRVMVRIVGGS